MVFVWSYLSDGDPAYTLVQVSVNDLIMLVAVAPIVKFLIAGTAGLEVPFRVLFVFRRDLRRDPASSSAQWPSVHC